AENDPAKCSSFKRSDADFKGEGSFDPLRSRCSERRRRGSRGIYLRSTSHHIEALVGTTVERNRTPSNGSLSKFHIELIDLFGLALGRFDPFDHFGHCQDLFAIDGTRAIDLDVVGREACYHRRIHRVGHSPLAEKKRTTVSGEAFAPD